ncbi:MAG: nucleoside monophosphate kinase [bacterium]|nr:nucleoside monophosphate kinase [bacterium]
MRDVLLLFGMQGSGKGTQGERIKERYGRFTDVIVGQLLREGAKTNPEMQALMKTGKLFPNPMIEAVIEERIKTIPEDERIIFDGFPRSEIQLEIYENLAKKHGFKSLAVDIIITEEEALKRLSKRYVCPQCDYVAIGSGKCPKCGADLEKRVDDQDETAVKQRISIFKKDTRPIMDYFKQEGELIEVDGVGTFDEVTERIFKKLDDYYKK